CPQCPKVDPVLTKVRTVKNIKQVIASIGQKNRKTVAGFAVGGIQLCLGDGFTSSRRNSVEATPRVGCEQDDAALIPRSATRIAYVADLLDRTIRHLKLLQFPWRKESEPFSIRRPEWMMTVLSAWKLAGRKRVQRAKPEKVSSAGIGGCK